MFRGSVKSIGYPLYSPVSPSLPLPCVTVCHHISTGLYTSWTLLHSYPAHITVCSGDICILKELTYLLMKQCAWKLIRDTYFVLLLIQEPLIGGLESVTAELECQRLLLHNQQADYSYFKSRGLIVLLQNQQADNYYCKTTRLAVTTAEVTCGQLLLQNQQACSQNCSISTLTVVTPELTV